MNKYVVSAICLLLTAVSCEEDLVVYDVTNGQTLAKFSTTSANLGVPIGGSSIEIFVEVTTQSENPRSFTLAIDPSSTATSDQYSIKEAGIPSGSFRGSITITGNFEALPDVGATTLVLILADVSDSNNLTIPESTLTISLFRECDPAPTPGLWSVTMRDSFGDGWQTSTGSGGPGLTCTLNTGEVFEFGLCSPYEPQSYDCISEPYVGSATFSIPEGTNSAEWYFPGDFYGEISFSILAPNGNVVAEYGQGSPAGPVPIDYCSQ
ncbi:hypothetical protein [Robiginitalea sp. SC105]|uniref:hypothetical protein n=1 Tax=Robiginitalea sp. SC105 TaxID=2762332 RepID=UPI00163A0ABB|nr:hypothetical protein [Robiginitalea sp. SC105]MBC2839669.1 hypothetical protein [Robiginitalea sp. SC105]